MNVEASELSKKLSELSVELEGLGYHYAGKIGAQNVASIMLFARDLENLSNSMTQLKSLPGDDGLEKISA